MNANPDYAAVTRHQRSVWATGDYSVIAPQLMPAAESLVATADVHAGARVLDIACGSGNVALVAARRYAAVTAVDYVDSLLDRARERAKAERTPIEFVLGDAQALPFENASFDRVLSAFGVMFAPDQARAASELARVCKPGGVVGVASWTPEGAIGEFFGITARYAQAPSALPSPLRWGTEIGLRELFGAHVRSPRFRRVRVFEYFRSPEHALEVFRTVFGPVRSAFEALSEPAQQQMAKEFLDHFSANNVASDGTLACSLEYLEAMFEVC